MKSFPFLRTYADFAEVYVAGRQLERPLTLPMIWFPAH